MSKQRVAFEAYWAAKWEVAFGKMTRALSANVKEIALEALEASRAAVLAEAAPVAIWTRTPTHPRMIWFAEDGHDLAAIEAEQVRRGAKVHRVYAAPPPTPEAKFGGTPGEWRAYDDGYHWLVIGPGAEMLADLHNPWGNPAATEANARLMAASKDLLEALLLTLPEVMDRNYPGRVAKAQAAIDKALGRRPR